MSDVTVTLGARVVRSPGSLWIDDGDDSPMHSIARLADNSDGYTPRLI